MMGPNELTPRARNFYLEEEYFSLNVKNGVLRTASGTRVVALPAELIQGLHEGLAEETGNAAGVVLYQCGRWWGRQFLHNQQAEIRAFYGMEMVDLPLGFFLQVLNRIWALYGWGRLDLDFTQHERGLLEAHVTSTLYSDVVGNIGRPADHLVAGMLGAVVGGLAGRELECVETACRSRGDRACTFLLGTASRLERVRGWVQQGNPHAEIVEALQDGMAA